MSLNEILNKELLSVANARRETERLLDLIVSEFQGVQCPAVEFIVRRSPISASLSECGGHVLLSVYVNPSNEVYMHFSFPKTPNRSDERVTINNLATVLRLAGEALAKHITRIRS